MRKVKDRGSNVSLPAEAKRTVARVGDDGIPADVEPHLTPPDPEIRAARTIAAAH